MNKHSMKAHLQDLESFIASREEARRKFEAESKRFWDNIEKINTVSSANNQEINLIAERRAS